MTRGALARRTRVPQAFSRSERTDPLLPVLILTIVLIVPFWALIIRPQQQRQRDHKAFVETLAPGDRVEAFSGIHGTIAEVDETTVRVEVAPEVIVTMAKLAISSRLPDASAPAVRLEDPMGTSEPQPSSSADHEGGAA